MQLGTPEEVYQEPLTEFVADFLGVANLLDVECLPGSAATRTVRYGEFTLEAQAPAGDDPTARRAVIRPECVEVQEPGLTGANRLPGMVDRAVFLGSTTQVMVRLPQGAVVQSLVTNTRDATPWPPGSRSPSACRRSRSVCWPRPTGPSALAADGCRRRRRSAVVGEVLERRARPRLRARKPTYARISARNEPTRSSVAKALSAGVGAARTALYSLMGTVMFAASPNRNWLTTKSSSEVANTIIAEAKIDGIRSGIKIVRIACKGLAPRSRAASSYSPPMPAAAIGRSRGRRRRRT